MRRLGQVIWELGICRMLAECHERCGHRKAWLELGHLPLCGPAAQVRSGGSSHFGITCAFPELLGPPSSGSHFPPRAPGGGGGRWDRSASATPSPVADSPVGASGGTRASAVAPPTLTAQAGAQASLRPQASSPPVAPPGVWDAKESKGSKLPGRVGSDLSKQQCCPGPLQYWSGILAGSGPQQASLGLRGPRDI